LCGRTCETFGFRGCTRKSDFRVIYIAMYNLRYSVKVPYICRFSLYWPTSAEKALGVVSAVGGWIPRKPVISKCDSLGYTIIVPSSMLYGLHIKHTNAIESVNYTNAANFVSSLDIHSAMFKEHRR